MATSNPPTAGRVPVDTQRGTPRVWGWTLALGILMILVGAFALYASVLTSVVSVLFIGITLMVAGIFEIVSAFRYRHQEPFIVYLLVGVLAFVVGLLFVARPLVGLAGVTMLIIGYLVASGAFRAVTALSARYPHWGWDLAYGVLAVALGVYLAGSWPVTKLWLLGMLVAIDIIARGATLISASWIVRDIQHHDRGMLAPA